MAALESPPKRRRRRADQGPRGTRIISFSCPIRTMRLMDLAALHHGRNRSNFICYLVEKEFKALKAELE